MLHKRSLLILAGLLAITALMILVSWSPATVVAQGPSTTPVPPVAVLKVAAVPGNAALPGAITATVSYITDTAVGAAKGTVAMGTTGLSNVPINVPVRLVVSAADPKNGGKPAWTLVAPAGSKAKFADPAATAAEFTPDVVGAYMVGVTLKNDAGVSSGAQFAFFNAGTYIGIDAGNCKQCHPTKVAEWAKTGHAIVFSKSLDNLIFGPGRAGMYSETCLPCHTVGYYVSPVGAGAGGFAEAKAKANWALPTFKQQDAAFAKTAPSNLESAPAAVKNMGNIQCEECHGPASQHVQNGAKVMAVSFENGACNVCHAAGGHHIKGVEEGNSKHVLGSSFEEITGPAEQACQRCHSGAGFASFLVSPTNPAAWANEASYVGCPTCHDPHSDANFAQLRVVGKPVQVPFQGAKDVGLSGICETCHNNRSTGGDDYVKAAPGASTPHYASDAEMLSDLGGVTYGQTVPNSPHGAMVGVAPVPDPATPGAFLWSKSGDAKGNTPGPCVYCHMYPGLGDAKDPNYMKVGAHTFNTTNAGFDYGASCKSCHGDVKDFNLKAKADYDGNGKVEGVQDEVKGLLNVLWKQLEAKGVKKQAGGYPYATLPANADASIKSAWYNFRYVYGVMWGTDAAGSPTLGNQGAAAAVHNFKRAVALLELSIKDLNGGTLPAGMTDATK